MFLPIAWSPKNLQLVGCALWWWNTNDEVVRLIIMLGYELYFRQLFTRSFCFLLTEHLCLLTPHKNVIQSSLHKNCNVLLICLGIKDIKQSIIKLKYYSSVVLVQVANWLGKGISYWSFHPPASFHQNVTCFTPKYLLVWPTELTDVKCCCYNFNFNLFIQHITLFLHIVFLMFLSVFMLLYLENHFRLTNLHPKKPLI